MPNWLQKMKHTGELVLAAIFIFLKACSIPVIFWGLFHIFSTMLPSWLGFALMAAVVSYYCLYIYADTAIRIKMEDTTKTLLTSVILVIVCAYNLVSIYAVYLITPSWVFPTSIIVTIAYFFDRIPQQHIWNPSVRELYPHRQWRVERIIVERLHSMRLAPMSRLTRSSSKVPPEIWSLILDYALDIPFFYDTECKAEHFNLFMNTQVYDMTRDEYSRIGKERTVIRVVCKLWKIFSDQHMMRWLGPRTRSNNISPRLERVDFAVGQGISVHSIPPPYQAFLDSLVASPDHVSSVVTLVLCQTILNPGHSLPEFFREHIIPRSRELSNVRSLLLSACLVLPHSFLKDIEQSFSSLTVLRLEGYVEDSIRGLTLEQLDILHINLQQYYNNQSHMDTLEANHWWFPRLRHLVLGERHFVDSQRFHSGLIPAPAGQILSLVLLPTGRYPVIQADVSFWNQLSSLRFLGVPPELFQVIDNAPLDHPLVHFCIPDTHSVWRRFVGADIISPYLRRVTDITHSIPALKYLTIPPPCGEDAYYTEGWRALFRVHRSRGLSWLNECGDAVDGAKGPEGVIELPELKKFILFYGVWMGQILLPACLEDSRQLTTLIMTGWLPCLALVYIYYFWTRYKR